MTSNNVNNNINLSKAHFCCQVLTNIFTFSPKQDYTNALVLMHSKNGFNFMLVISLVYTVCPFSLCALFLLRVTKWEVQ